MSDYSEQAEYFAAFRRESTAADEELANNTKLRAFYAGEPGARVDLARVVYKDSQTTLGVFPSTEPPAGGSGVCLIASGSEAGIASICGQTARLASGQDVLALRYEGESGDQQLYGVLPDGAHDVTVTDVNGQVTSVPLSSDGGFVAMSSVPLVSWSYVTPNGTTRAIRLPARPSLGLSNPESG